MSGFISGAIDPALLSGGGNTNSNNNDSNSTSATDNNHTNNNTSTGTGGINHRPIGQSSSTQPTGLPSSSTFSLHSSSFNPPPSSSASPNPTNTLNPNNSSVQNPSSSHTAPPSSFSNFNNHGLNLPSSSSSSLQPSAATALIPPASSSSSLPNGTAPGPGTPATTETPLSNGMSAKDHEMHQKDQELAQFLLKMEEYKPVIPDEVAAYYLQRVGFECTDVKVQRLLVLACQKFVSDIAQDAFSYARTRTGQAPGGRQGPLAPNSNSAGLANGAPNNPGARKDRTRTVLTQEDLAQALAEYGINASRAPYYL
ncbi:uncharacterized protein PGTG_15394 [Puccinia graminis f. sp. tritici CRL 75-36-700-3]|uniref:Transcription initiation factor TFIID subunit 10 n=1 Tax=Puccinia graminis f. sp. tritici (strain CRL 75-36-700-3 / race SCCL) TaxID=418459 RepID=E3KZL3_PUCGT|nr:uncharacterized protein PGTG_15394 [Puccinia graminis f. sp. tritici CRL 75-36-700-3]EFP89738.1 hypothetical protein PGTG_15394 [Puccinia graminis f. sp. tritici CRL 75-36-700-3]